VVQRAAALCGGEIVDEPDLPEAVRGGAREPLDPLDPIEGLTLREAVARLERQMIARALDRAGGNRSEAARTLGISRRALYNKLDGYRGEGLEIPRPM
ncbi:MAG TPA: helix-turn-helix domain-containing protein, partial [Phycisphaerales bacterium]|nr:helix-turn-helix domain-containing protein [Phycisphaerales bacterium]